MNFVSKTSFFITTVKIYAVKCVNYQILWFIASSGSVLYFIDIDGNLEFSCFLLSVIS